MPPITPQHVRDDFPTFLASLIQRYGIETPIPQNYSPISLQKLDTPPWRVFKGLRALYYKNRQRLDDVLANFDEWIAGRTVTARQQPNGKWKRSARRGSTEPEVLSDEEKDARLMYLRELVDDAMWFLDNNASVSSKRVSKNPTENVPELVPKRRRLSDEDEDEFVTAPGSPVKTGAVVGGQSAQLDLERVDDPLLRSGSGITRSGSGTSWSALADGQSDGFGTTKVSPFVQRLTGMQPPPRNDFKRYDAVPSAADRVSTSFSTVASGSVFTSHGSRLGESFETDITEPIATQSTYADSVVNLYLEEEINTSMSARMGGGSISYLSPLRERLVEELLRHGPFSQEQPFPGSIPLRHRYELERIGRCWDIPLSSVYKGSEMSPSFNDHDKFWSWVQTHKQGNSRALPEKTPRRAFINEQDGFTFQARAAIEKASTLPPPSHGTHWLITLWQNRHTEWQTLLAFCLYTKDRKKNFVFHAFGETLCNLKAASFASRCVTNDVLSTYRVNQKVVARLTAREMPVESVDGDEDEAEEGEYEGAEVIESLLGSQAGLEVFEDWDDGMSVE